MSLVVKSALPYCDLSSDYMILARFLEVFLLVLEKSQKGNFYLISSNTPLQNQNQKKLKNINHFFFFFFSGGALCAAGFMYQLQQRGPFTQKESWQLRRSLAQMWHGVLLLGWAFEKGGLCFRLKKQFWTSDQCRKVFCFESVFFSFAVFSW